MLAEIAAGQLGSAFRGQIRQDELKLRHDLETVIVELFCAVLLTGERKSRRIVE